jgi:hypothetical protein
MNRQIGSTLVLGMLAVTLISDCRPLEAQRTQPSRLQGAAAAQTHDCNPVVVVCERRMAGQARDSAELLNIRHLDLFPESKDYRWEGLVVGAVVGVLGMTYVAYEFCTKAEDASCNGMTIGAGLAVGALVGGAIGGLAGGAVPKRRE